MPGLIWIPDYPFDERQADFNFASLLTRPEVILLLTQVQDECNKAATISLFNSTLAKHVCLEEFEQIQTQTFTQVSRGSVGGEQQGCRRVLDRCSSCRLIPWKRLSFQRSCCGWGREEFTCVCQIYWNVGRMG